METKAIFKRSFLIFENEDPGYEAGQKPKGYIKIEERGAKGKLWLSVQNLKDSPLKYIYELYLIRASVPNFAAAFIGTLVSGNNGHVLEQSFDALNVAGTGVRMQDFDTAAILVKFKDKYSSRVVCPLAAYKSERTNWRSKIDLMKIESAASGRQENLASVQQNKTIANNQSSIHNRRPAGEGLQAKAASIRPVTVEELAVKPPETNLAGDRKGNEKYQPYVPEARKDTADKEYEANKKAEAEVYRPEQAATVPESVGIDLETGNNASVKAEDRAYEDYNAKTGTGADTEGNNSTGTGVEGGVYRTEESDGTSGSAAQPRGESDRDPVPMSPDPVSPPVSQVPYDKVNTGCFYMNGNTCGINMKSLETNPCAGCRIYTGAPEQTKKEQSAGNVVKLRQLFESNFEKCDPFNVKRTDYSWWKVANPVNLNNILYECGIRSPLLFNPAVMMSHYKYRHMIIGLYYDRQSQTDYLVCGVPGMHMVDKKPFNDMCRWVQLEGSKPVYGAFGYWLVYIEPKTGRLINVR